MRIFLGLVFLILGILGIILPIIPGIPFLLLSAFLFGFIDEKRVIKVLKKLKTNKKNSFLNKMINFVILKYIHKKDISPVGKNG